MKIKYLALIVLLPCALAGMLVYLSPGGGGEPVANDVEASEKTANSPSGVDALAAERDADIREKLALKEKASQLGARIAELEDENRGLRDRLAAIQLPVPSSSANTIADQTQSAIKMPDPFLSGNAQGPRNIEELMSKFWNSPEAKEFVKNRAKQRYDGLWSAFSPYMDKDTRARFDDMMVEHQLAMQQMRQGGGRGGPAGGRDEAREKAKLEEAAFEEKIVSDFGDDTYRQYLAYKETLPVRERVQRMTQSNFKLEDSARKESLIQAMLDVNNRHDWAKAAQNPFSVPREQRAELVQKLAVLNVEYLERSRLILSVEEQAAFQQNLERDQRRLERFGGRGAGGQSPENQPAEAAAVGEGGTQPPSGQPLPGRAGAVGGAQSSAGQPAAGAGTQPSQPRAPGGIRRR